MSLSLSSCHTNVARGSLLQDLCSSFAYSCWCLMMSLQVHGFYHSFPGTERSHASTVWYLCLWFSILCSVYSYVILFVLSVHTHQCHSLFASAFLLSSSHDSLLSDSTVSMYSASVMKRIREVIGLNDHSVCWTFVCQESIMWNVPSSGREKRRGG